MSQQIQTLNQWINGAETEAAGNLQTFHSPWDQSLLAQWKSADEMDVIRCLQSCKKFLALPAGWPHEERQELLTKLKMVIEKNIEAWSEQEAIHQGLPQNFC